jgi:hypothetical protein
VIHGRIPVFLMGSLGLMLVGLTSSLSAPVPRQAAIRAVRFDPGYYYNTGLSVDVLAERLARHWANSGVNLIYFYAYSYAYGARYRTGYRYNAQEDFGRLNLMPRVVAEAHRRGIQVVAWVYPLRHKGAWQAEPQWRSLTATGQPYRSGVDEYFLSPHSPEALAWWLGFLEDLLRAVPGITGVDFAEPVVNWWGAEADYSEVARAAFAQAFPHARPGGPEWRRHRADAMTRVLEESMRLVRRYEKQVHVTTVFTARANGALITPDEQCAETGFDLSAVLEGPVRPDYVNVELIFQQWADAHRAPAVFTPEWTAGAARSAAALLRGRAGFIAHIELSEFGTIRPTLQEFARALRSLRAAGFADVDIYDTSQMDALGAWEVFVAGR